MTNRTIKKTIAILIFVIVLGSTIAAYAMTRQNEASAVDSKATYTVKRGPLTINLTETGTIKSRDQFIVKSEVEGRTSIIFVVDEGTVVQKGELLVELDSSDLQDRLVDQQIKVENTDADHISAQENLEVARIRSTSNIAKAELENRFAIEDKIKYLQGEWPKTLMESETALTLAQEDVRRATDKFDWSTKLFEEKYLSETEFRADELALKRAELQEVLALEKLNLLKEFTHTRKIDELDSEITQKELSLQRVSRESSSQFVQAEARMRAYAAELTRQKKRLEKIEDQITKTKIFAPADGMVVYATSTQMSWRGDSQPLDEGQEVYERQELIHLPTADSMMVVVRIHESALGKVKVGQNVQIEIDAIAGSNFTGKVAKIAPLPDATSVFMNPDLKVYDTQIMIDGIYPEIRTGMSCKATIMIEHHDEALSVPMQSVVGHNGKSVVYVVGQGQSIPRPVETGLDNNSMVHILSGIQDGDRVMLIPPLSNDSTATSSQSPNQSPTSQPKPSPSKRPARTAASSGNKP